MTSFDVLFKDFVSIEPADLSGYLAAKASTLLGYCKEDPRIVPVFKQLATKVITADGVLDITEIAVFDQLKQLFKGEALDIDEFLADVAKFVENGADAGRAEAAFGMLPEYIRDDIIFFLLVLTTVDNEISKEEAEYISTLAF